MNFIDLFAGIGGFSLGLERAGMKCIGQVEIDPFCNRVLEHYWPDVKRVKDIHDVTGSTFRTAGLICGGVPCQPASNAGKRRGTEDDHWLWPETFRVVRFYMPAWCLFENVRGITSLENGMVFDNLLSEMEDIGYEVQTFVIPACAVDAHHRRDRTWIVAYSNKRGFVGSGICTKQPWRTETFGTGQTLAHSTEIRRGEGDSITGGACDGTGATGQRCGLANRSDVSNPYVKHGNIAGYGAGEICREREETEIRESFSNAHSQRLEEQRSTVASEKEYSKPEQRNRWLSESGIRRVANGIPGRVDRLRSLGNAVVPQIVEKIGRAIMEAECQP